MKVVILDGYCENPGDLSWDWIKEMGYELVCYDLTPPEKIIERAKDADILVTNKCVISEDIIKALPKLKYIQVIATGYNVIDCQAARENGVIVCNIPAYSTDGVAQLVFSLLLELTQQVGAHDKSVKDGDWAKSEHFCYQKTYLTELSGKTMGIIGFGRIGQAVAQIANAFKMKTIVYAPRPKVYTGFGEVEFVSLDELISSSDVISLHCPLTPETENLVNAEFLSKCKNSVYIINTARGTVVDEKALADALENGTIAGFGADVLSCEPPKEDNPLLKAKNSFITPHIAWANIEARTRLMNIFKENLAAFTAGEVKNKVN